MVELHNLSDSLTVQRARVPLPQLIQSETFTMKFAPQHSEGRHYAIDISVEGASDGQGIGFLASRGESSSLNPLFFDQRLRWSELIFDTTVDEARSNFARLADTLGGLGIPVPVLTLIALLTVGNTVVLFMIHMFISGHIAVARLLQKFLDQEAVTLRGPTSP